MRHVEVDDVLSIHRIGDTILAQVADYLKLYHNGNFCLAGNLRYFRGAVWRSFPPFLPKIGGAVGLVPVLGDRGFWCKFAVCKFFIYES
jgi:hypothetical protein